MSDKANSIVFFRDRILIQFVHTFQPNKDNEILIPIYTPKSYTHRVWVNGQWAFFIESTPTEWRLEVETELQQLIYKGRLESITNEGQITIFGQRVGNDDDSTERRRVILRPKSFLLEIVRPDTLYVRSEEISRSKECLVSFELDGIDWSFSHLMRFAENKKSAILDTIIEIPATEITNSWEDPDMLFNEARFVNTNYVTSTARPDRAYGVARFATADQADAETAAAVAPTSSRGSTDQWGQWRARNLNIMRHRSQTLSVSHLNLPAVMMLVYMFEGLEHGNPTMMIDCSSRECQEVLQQIESGPLTIYDASGKNISRGSKLDALTKRIDMGKFSAISFKCQRVVDNLVERFHDEKFVVFNKTDATHELFIWQPRDAIRVLVQDKEYVPAIDPELQVNVIKVPLQVKPGRSEVLYRWFYN